MSWCIPIPFRLVPTSDSMSFQHMAEGETGLPLTGHPGSFAHVRKHHTHEGVDLYCPEGTPVHAVETGYVVAIIAFTGAAVGSPWWHDTVAVLVEGESGVVVYGEIIPRATVGSQVQAGDLIGNVKQVLTKDKGRPMSMLHLELHKKGARDAPAWETQRPDTLLDPTSFLLEACKQTAAE
jgi:murein DD-endopeptidase MepM/ murein hydrolase activator NlpD